MVSRSARHGVDFTPSARGTMSRSISNARPRRSRYRAHRRDNEHLDIYASVIGVAALHDACTAKGVAILKPLERTPWGTKDFYIADPEGYIIAFGEADNPN
ncbi:MAG: VOC family protein [Xanthobacteraceae bacterium]